MVSPPVKALVFLFDWDVEYLHLYKKEGNDWKNHRTVMFKRDNTPLLSRKAAIQPISDKEAFDIARIHEAKINMASINGDEDGFLALLSDHPSYYPSSGEAVIGKKESLNDLQKWNNRVNAAVAGYPHDVVRISDDIIYYMGGYNGNYINKNSGSSGSMKPGEFITILKKINGKWVDDFTVAFKRGRVQEASSIAKGLFHDALEAVNEDGFEKFSRYLTDEAVQMNSTGKVLVGKPAIEKYWKESEKLMSNVHETGKVGDAIFLSDDAIFAFGSFELSGTLKKDNSKINNAGDIAALIVKDGNDWKYSRLIGNETWRHSRKSFIQPSGRIQQQR